MENTETTPEEITSGASEPSRPDGTVLLRHELKAEGGYCPRTEVMVTVSIADGRAVTKVTGLQPWPGFMPGFEDSPDFLWDVSTDLARFARCIYMWGVEQGKIEGAARKAKDIRIALQLEPDDRREA